MSRTERSRFAAKVRRPLEAAYLRERITTTLERCDCCGAVCAVLIREPVEGVICERCPECRERGETP